MSSTRESGYRRDLFSFFLPGLALFILFGLPAAMAAEAPVLTIYNGRKAEFVQPLLQAFTEETGIRVKLVNNAATVLLNKMSLEGDKTAADVFIANDGGNLQRGSDFGIFSALPKDLLKEVPASMRDANNKWVGLSLRTRVLVVNTRSEVGKSVKSVLDLSDPALKGRIGITTSLNESFIDGVTMYLHVLGRDRLDGWLRGLKANIQNDTFKKHSHIVKAVAKGEKDVGLVNHYYVLRHLKKHPDAPIRIIFPDQRDQAFGIAWNLSGIAVSRHSQNREAAIKLVRFLLSPKRQKEFAQVNMEYPTRRNVSAVDALPALTTLNMAKVPVTHLSRMREKAIERLDIVNMPR